MAIPHTAISTTTTEVIDFSIEFGIATLYYVVVESFRTLHVDFITFHCEITVLCIFSCVFAHPTS
jgi:hypothetical protein